MRGNCALKSSAVLFYCSLALLIVAGSCIRVDKVRPVGLAYRIIPRIHTHDVNATGTTAPVRQKGLWDYLVDGQYGSHSKVVLFSTNIWGGFGNSFRGLRGLCVYALLKGAKIRGIGWEWT